MLDAAVAALGGQRRDGQLDMAQAVAAALRTGEHLAVQAGTGTGKSLAYLVPAIRHAVQGRSTVVVSTATIALQRQLVDRDLPRLAAALEPLLGRAPTFAILKGRRNYLCLHKLHGDASVWGPAEDDAALFDPFAVSAMGRQVKRVHEWATTTGTGDRDELVPGVTEAAWRQVSVSARECLGLARCPSGGDCFAEKARAEAGRVDVVVTNHALLAIDALENGIVLPEHDLVVVDEAHDLVDRVTGVATAELTSNAVAAAAKRCARLVDQAVVDRLAEAGDGLAVALADAPAGRWERMPPVAATVLAAVRDAAGACRTALGQHRREDTDNATARRLALALLDEVQDTAVRLLAAFADDDPAARREVVWLADEERRGLVLRIAPLAVGGLLRDRLFARCTVVLTSATLALGGAFDTLARQWGLPPSGSQPAGTPGAGKAGSPEAGAAKAGAPEAGASRTAGLATQKPPPGAGDQESPRWTGLDVGSPFQYRRSAILYIARHLPPPGRDGLPPAYLAEIEQLVTAAGGRTLGLFSSMRAARQAADELRERLTVPVLCQGEDATAALVGKFAADESTCLFGTLSLWQGVDVPGPSLQLVIVDRIPFPRPDDPLTAARQRAVDARGGSGFMTVAASHAALRLAQGAGRLVRTMTDRGVVAVLDPRLATARYGSFLRATLPPFWQTTDPEVVRAALRRLAAPPPQPSAG